MIARNLLTEVKAWLKRKHGPDEVIRVVPDSDESNIVFCYQLYTAFDPEPEHLGRILFDAEGYWIYDGHILSVTEQEQVARFIINYAETL